MVTGIQVVHYCEDGSVVVICWAASDPPDVTREKLAGYLGRKPDWEWIVSPEGARKTVEIVTGQIVVVENPLR